MPSHAETPHLMAKIVVQRHRTAWRWDMNKWIEVREQWFLMLSRYVLLKSSQFKSHRLKPFLHLVFCLGPTTPRSISSGCGKICKLSSKIHATQPRPKQCWHGWRYWAGGRVDRSKMQGQWQVFFLQYCRFNDAILIAPSMRPLPLKSLC